MNTVLFWHRRDMRLDDNHGLFQALSAGEKLISVFVFDTAIMDKLDANDRRLNLIYNRLVHLKEQYRSLGGDLLVRKGDPKELIPAIAEEFGCKVVYSNEDYEPYARDRDDTIREKLNTQGKSLELFKDQVVFEKNEVLKPDGKPYTVFTPFKKRWLLHLKEEHYAPFDSQSLLKGRLSDKLFELPTKASLGIEEAEVILPSLRLENIVNYEENRNFPAVNKCSFSSVYLRFGFVSPRFLVRKAVEQNETYLSELIWREFFMVILYHFPRVAHSNFKPKYDHIEWRNNKEDFERWCAGETGYPIVDAGMRELNETGLMHNRVRMITAGFLCKHLLIDWKWGEAYFAKKLLDYELSSNNGNWQWAAGTGCDAAPYFRVFNPYTQVKKFDKDLEYIKTWVPDLNELTYPNPMVEHKMARQRAIDRYKEGLNRSV